MLEYNCRMHIIHIHIICSRMYVWIEDRDASKSDFSYWKRGCSWTSFQSPTRTTKSSCIKRLFYHFFFLFSLYVKGFDFNVNDWSVSKSLNTFLRGFDRFFPAQPVNEKVGEECGQNVNYTWKWIHSSRSGKIVALIFLLAKI